MDNKDALVAILYKEALVNGAVNLEGLVNSGGTNVPSGMTSSK